MRTMTVRKGDDSLRPNTNYLIGLTQAACPTLPSRVIFVTVDAPIYTP